METGIRKNTVKLVFETGAKAPIHLDVLRFIVENLKLGATDLHSVYKDENEGKFYLKFMDEAAFSSFLNNLEEEYLFEYNDGTSAVVQLITASRIFRYIRIFNLPPEIDEKTIAQALSQYGTIRQHVRERYPIDFQFCVYNGVRGVHMELSKEIPANMYIGHFRARIFYEGLKNRCFHCKEEGHLKSSCPKLAAGSPSGGVPRSYSSVTTHGKSVPPPVSAVPEFRPQMQVLKSKTVATTVSTVPKNPKAAEPVVPVTTEVAISPAPAPVVQPVTREVAPAGLQATSGNAVAGPSKSPEEIRQVLLRMTAETTEPMDTNTNKPAPKRPALSSSDGEETVADPGEPEVDAEGFQKAGGKRSKKKSKSAIKTIETRSAAKGSK